MPIEPLFPLGTMLATPGALEALIRAEQQPMEFLRRHANGDWGELDPEDVQENDFSLKHGFRLLSSCTTRLGEKIWAITEADRQVTTLLLPAEYSLGAG